MKNAMTLKTRIFALLVLMLGLFLLPGLTGYGSLLKAQPNAWINEFHYDNAGTDVNEFVEIVIEHPGLYSLADFRVHLYNGSDNKMYNTSQVSAYTVGGTVGNFILYYRVYPVNGIQNGNPDGIALSYQNTLIPGQFLSYGGVFTAIDGPASGVTSVDIGYTESSATPIGHSLQLAGNGSQYNIFNWQPAAVATMGLVNNNQTLINSAPVSYCGDIVAFSFPQQDGPAVIDDVNAEVHIQVLAGTSLTNLVATFDLCDMSQAFDMTNASYNLIQSGVTAIDYTTPVFWQVIFGDESDYRIWKIVVTTSQAELPAIVINEVDYDQPGTDFDEFIELKNTGSQPVNLLDMKIELISGGLSTPASYRTIYLPDYDLAPGGYYVVCIGNVPNCNYVVPGVSQDLIQNGAPDAIALYSATGMLLDMLSYEGNTTGYTEGSGVGLIDAGNAPNLGLSRWPDGADTDVNNQDFRLLCITPGAANVDDEGPCICTVFGVVVDSVGECDPLTNSYEAWLIVEYTKAPTGGYLSVNADQFPITGSPQTVHLVNRPSNGLAVDVAVSFTENPACSYTATALYTAPDPCNNCAISNVSIQSLGSCDPETNTYEVALLLTALNFSSSSMGVQIGTKTWNVPLLPPPSTGQYLVVLQGLFADGQAVSVLLFNPDDPGCAILLEDFWQAPVYCFVPPAIVINEVDYDQTGADNAEFIELKNNTIKDVNLQGYRLILINGANNQIYQNYLLPDAIIPAGGYFVICANAATVPNCDLDVSPNTDMIQNGAPDAIALLDPFGGIVDAVSYEGNVPGYTEGSGVGLADPGTGPAQSIGRYPDGVDTDVNNVDFIYSCITPGEPNVNISGYCGPFHTIAASVYYENEFQTVMPDVVVSLYRNGAFVETQTTGINGEVVFSNLPNGTFTFDLDLSAYDFGGVNSSDALNIAKHYTGLMTLSPFAQEVGDVAVGSGLNSTDALMVVRRFVGLITSFTVGDWYTTQPALVINATADSYFGLDFPVSCYGDVNGSYLPDLKSTGVMVQEEGLVQIHQNILSLPISLDQAVNLGAVSLEIKLPDNMTVIGVEMGNGDETLFQQDGSMLRITWFNIHGWEIQARETFMTLVLKVAPDFSRQSLQFSSNCSLGDADGKELKMVSMIIPAIIGDETILKVYPNPATHTFKLDMLLSVDQVVVVELFNMLGEKMQSLDFGHCTAGIHHAQVDVSGLSKGTYLLRMSGSVESSTTRLSIVR